MVNRPRPCGIHEPFASRDARVYANGYRLKIIRMVTNDNWRGGLGEVGATSF
jgi:hypothetical protein